MRITLTKDDDLLAVARSMAKDRSETVDQAVSELIRRGLSATARVHKTSKVSSLPVFSVKPGAHPITLEDVRKAEDFA